MSGHSKWHSIRHKKAAVDAKRGKLFTKLIKEITVAARLGGGNPDGNPRLRTAIAKAKEANMPAENIKRAIQKGTGELPGTVIEEAVYEGYGPGGVAVLVEVATDNKNRTTSEIRHLFSKYGGSLGEAGCVAWMFQKRGYILVDKQGVDEDALMALVMEAGAEDLKNSPDEPSYEIITAPEDLEKVRQALRAQGFPVQLAEISMVPQSYVTLNGKEAEQMLRLMEMLEDHDDVQHVYANFNVPEEVLQRVES